MATSRICSIPGCGKPSKGRGWCGAHWNLWRAHGDPLSGGTKHGEPLRFILDTVLPYEGNECLIWPFSRDDKGRARMRRDGRPQQVPRIICEFVHGPAPSKLHQAAHSCGKGHEGCVTKGHLSWKTPSGNQMDRVGHGTSTRGENHGMSRLMEDDVRQIRRLCANMLQRDIATKFGVSRATVSMILSGKRWVWL